MTQYSKRAEQHVDLAERILRRHQLRSVNDRCACGCAIRDEAEMQLHLVNVAIELGRQAGEREPYTT